MHFLCQIYKDKMYTQRTMCKVEISKCHKRKMRQNVVIVCKWEKELLSDY